MITVMGLFSFTLFGIYDINQVRWNKQWLNGGFFIGLLVLVAATTLLLVSSRVIFEGTTGQLVMLIISGGFFLLLLYTLFLALPFSGTYIEKVNGSNKKFVIKECMAYVVIRGFGGLRLVIFH